MAAQETKRQSSNAKQRCQKKTMIIWPTDGANVSQESLIKQRISELPHLSTSISTAQRADHIMITSAFLKHTLAYYLTGDAFFVFFPLFLPIFY